jgi:hypothetical protein
MTGKRRLEAERVNSTIYLDKEKKIWLRKLCIDLGITASDYVNNLLEREMAKSQLNRINNEGPTVYPIGLEG